MDWKINKHNKKKNKNKVNLLIPFAVTVVTWFIAFAYSNNSAETTSTVASTMVENLDKNISSGKNDINIKIAQPVSDTSDPVSFNLAQDGIQIPNKLPALTDIMLEMK